MAGTKVAVDKVAKPKEKAQLQPNAEAEQQETPQGNQQSQDTQIPKNPFELQIKNNGRRRLLQFCGVFLEAGQTTIVILQNQPEVDHVKDTLRQFNELAGRNDLMVEEAE